MGSWLTIPLFLLMLSSFATGNRSGILKLIVKTYVDELLSASDRLDDELTKAKLMKLGDHIARHPALGQKHLFVGMEPPNFDPDMTRSGRRRNMDSISKRTQESGTGKDTTGLVAQAQALTMASSTTSTTTTTTSPVTSTGSAVLPATGPTGSTGNASLPSSSSRTGKASDAGGGKVSNSQFPSEEICVTDRNWEQINETNDFYDNKVEIVQEEGLQQFVFTYRCANMKGACTGISPFYHSECTERFGWIYMYYRKSPSEQPQWGYVAAPHHCACKITPNVTPVPSPTEPPARK